MVEFRHPDGTVDEDRSYDSRGLSEIERAYLLKIKMNRVDKKIPYDNPIAADLVKYNEKYYKLVKYDEKKNSQIR